MPKILIVDDDHDLLEGQKAFLETKGYEVETAGSMEEGLGRLDSFKPVPLQDLVGKIEQFPSR